MPWFFFKAGMFFKKESVSKVVKKSFKRLLIPFIVFTIIGELTKLAVDIYTIDKSILTIVKFNTWSAFKYLILYGSSLGNLALWFLFSLFCVRIIYACLRPSRLYPLLLILFAIAPAMHYMGIQHPYYLATISSGLFFYAMGDICRNIKIQNTALCALLCIMWIGITFFMPTLVDMRANFSIMGCYYLWYPTSLIGILAINSFFSKWSFSFPILQYLGQNSMGYYCVHLMILARMEALLKPYLSPYAFLIIAILAMVTILPLVVVIIRRSRYSFLVK